MTEGDELAMQAQWIDLIAFDLLMGKLDAAKEIKEARYGSERTGTDLSVCEATAGTGSG